ncbi:HEAT repeat domain-containing protein [Nostoc linckia FACHB-104]|nr:HEAT repeat domain-containing protein [Nostoc linckia FACHB-104]
MKHHIIATCLLFLTLSACNLGAVKDSKVQRLADEKNVKELIAAYIQKPPTFGTDQAAEALGNLGDKLAVEPLIAVLNTPVKASASSAEIKTHAAAAIALGKLKDTRAVKPLVANVNHPNSRIANAAKTALKDIAATNPKIVDQVLPGFKKDDPASVIAMGAMGKPALEPMLAALKEPDARTRTNAASVLADIGDPKAIEPLTKNLTDWASSPMVGVALEKLNWQPVSDADKVHLLIAKSKGEELRNNWEMTKDVLLKDLASKDPRTLSYALYSFISIGGKDTTETLVKVLKENGNKNLALAYLNCGEPTLEKAAQDWATSRGYRVVKTARKDQQTVKWGSF